MIVGLILAIGMGGLLLVWLNLNKSPGVVMDNLRAKAPQVGLAMGLFFLIVGLAQSNYGIVGLGVVVALTGFFSRERGT
jgi:hypothetical protein